MVGTRSRAIRHSTSTEGPTVKTEETTGAPRVPIRRYVPAQCGTLRLQFLRGYDKNDHLHRKPGTRIHCERRLRYQRGTGELRPGSTDYSQNQGCEGQRGHWGPKQRHHRFKYWRNYALTSFSEGLSED